MSSSSIQDFLKMYSSKRIFTGIIFYTIWISFGAKSELFIVFSKEVILSKVAIYRLRSCNLVRKRMISRKKACEVLRRAILHSAREKISVTESFFKNFCGTDSRPVTLLKISFCLGEGQHSIFTVQKCPTWAPIFVQLWVVYYRTPTLIKRCNIDFFSQNIFLRQLVFRTYSKNNLWWSLLVVKLHCTHCRVDASLKWTTS